MDIPLNNPVRGPYCNPATDRLFYGPSAKHEGHELKWKNQGAVTYRTDREKKVNKMFNIPILDIESSWKAQHKVKLNQPIIAHV